MEFPLEEAILRFFEHFPLSLFHRFCHTCSGCLMVTLDLAHPCPPRPDQAVLIAFAFEAAAEIDVRPANAR